MSILLNPSNIETESHFLINCDLYRSEIEELLNTVTKIIPGIIILTNDDIFMLISNQDPVVTNALGKYIYNCLKKWSSTVLMSNVSQSRLSNQTSQTKICEAYQLLIVKQENVQNHPVQDTFNSIYYCIDILKGRVFIW